MTEREINFGTGFSETEALLSVQNALATDFDFRDAEMLLADYPPNELRDLIAAADKLSVLATVALANVSSREK